MKNKIVKGTVLIGLSTLVFACNSNSKKEEAAATPVADKEQIKSEIQARENEFAEVYNSGEMKNIGYYADDATSFYPNRPPLVGKQAIIEFLKPDSLNKHDKVSFTTNEVFPSTDGNQVLEVGSFKLVDSMNTVLNSGNYMVLFEKRDGKYVSVREMSNSDGSSVK